MLSVLVDTQRAAFAQSPPQYAQRLDALRRLEDALTSRRADIIAAVAEDFGGRAAVETLGLEVIPLLNEIHHARRNLSRWMAPRKAPVEWPCWPARARTLHQPLGVVGIVAPWNYPLYLSFGPLVGALAAGNHVLLKPSELAPATAELMRSIVSGLFRPAHVSVVTGGADIAAEFVRLPLDHLLFTGSPRVGTQVMRAASEHLVPVTLELGGKSPAIVHPDYPLQLAADRILTGKLYNAGQTCLAPDYVLLAPHRRDEFVSAAERSIGRMYPSLVNNADYTRIINTHHYRRLLELVADARRLGAQVIEVNPAGEVCTEANRVFPPTLVLNVRDDMALSREEIFGPVLPIMECGTVEDAIGYVNGRPHPLALYYFDTDHDRIDRVVATAVAGGMTVNDCLFHVGQTSLPFGGVGHSGMGRYHGFDGFQTFSNRKAVMFQSRWSLLALMRPPYNAMTRRLIEFLIRANRLTRRM